MRIYLSAPISNTPNYREVFAELDKLVQRSGHLAVNPLDIPSLCRGCQDPLPDKLHSWECFMRWDLVEMLKCDAAVFAKGWQRSQGCRLEHHVAVSCGIKTLRPDQVPLLLGQEAEQL